MNILCLADLHINLSDYFNRYNYNSALKQQLRNIIKDNNVDIILVAGDFVEKYVYIYEHNIDFNLYKFLNLFFWDNLEKNAVPIIFCLGNHEFAHSSVKRTKEAFAFAQKENENSFNIYCLDIVDNFVFNEINVVGNVLWYDGTCSLRTDRDKILKQLNGSGWLDETIEDFDPKFENLRCIEQIKNNIINDKTNILVTHTVPLFELNSFNFDQPTSEYNAYSGMNNLFEQHNIDNIDYAICGHTHRYEKNKYKNTECINIGNDYFFRTQKVKYYMLYI